MLITGISQMYWITRLTAIHDAFLFVFIASIIVSIVFGVFLIATSDEPTNYRGAKKTFTLGIIFAVLGGLGLTFVPKTSEALLIYGVGSTIDYVENNETIKQLPDKAVKALDKYLDSLN